MRQIIEVTVQRGVHPFNGRPVYRIYDKNGYLMGRTSYTEDEAMSTAAQHTGAELVVINRTEIDW